MMIDKFIEVDCDIESEEESVVINVLVQMIFLEDFSFPFLLEIIFWRLLGNLFVLKMVVEHVVVFGLSDDFKALNELEYLIKEI